MRIGMEHNRIYSYDQFRDNTERGWSFMNYTTKSHRPPFKPKAVIMPPLDYKVERATVKSWEKKNCKGRIWIRTSTGGSCRRLAMFEYMEDAILFQLKWL